YALVVLRAAHDGSEFVLRDPIHTTAEATDAPSRARIVVEAPSHFAATTIVSGSHCDYPYAGGSTAKLRNAVGLHKVSQPIAAAITMSSCSPCAASMRPFGSTMNVSISPRSWRSSVFQKPFRWASSSRSRAIGRLAEVVSQPGLPSRPR